MDVIYATRVIQCDRLSETYEGVPDRWIHDPVYAMCKHENPQLLELLIVTGNVTVEKLLKVQVCSRYSPFISPALDTC